MPGHALADQNIVGLKQHVAVAAQVEQSIRLDRILSYVIRYPAVEVPVFFSADALDVALGSVCFNIVAVCGITYAVQQAVIQRLETADK